MLNFCSRGIGITFLFLAQVSFAQTADIPLFWDEEEIEEEQQPNQPAAQPNQTPTQQTDKPQIGRNAPPLEKIGIVPPPFPAVEIPLPNFKSQKEIAEPEKKVYPAISLDDEDFIREEEHAANDVPSSPYSYDARDFELEDFYLGMTPIEIGKIALKKGYKITKSENDFPLFITTRYEQECRSEGVFMPAEIRNCIRAKGKTNNTIYLKSMTVSKPGKKESYYFEFTSPATQNRAWRITYTNLGDNSLNFNQVNTAKKIARRDSFFNAVFHKFGYPDDAKNFIWGRQDDAFMQVMMYGTSYDAKIILTDMELSDEDYFEAKDWLDEQTPIDQFYFGE